MKLSEVAIRAGMAQLVEHFTRNEGVVGSSPISSLKEESRRMRTKGYVFCGIFYIKNVPEALRAWHILLCVCPVLY